MKTLWIVGIASAVASAVVALVVISSKRKRAKAAATHVTKIAKTEVEPEVETKVEQVA